MSFYKRINSSIYYRFNFAMISLALSILLIIGLLSFGFMRHLVAQNIRQTLESDAVHSSQEFEHTMNLISESLINISANLIITNAIVDTAGREAYIAPFMKSFKLPNDISVKLTLCDFMGKPLESNVRNPREFNSPDLLRRTIGEGNGFAELEKNDNETGLLMALPVIWVMTNKPEGILVAEISLDELFANALYTFNISADRSISLLSGNTALLQKNKKAEDSFFQLKKPLRLSPPLDKMAFQLEINDYREIKTGWLVGLYCVVGLLFISVSLWVSKKISYLLTDRLTILSDATKRIAESGYLEFTAEVKGSDEVTALAIAFNAMIGKIREVRNSLEIRVEELSSVTQRLTLSTQSAKLGIWDWDITNNNMGWDDRMLELHGLTRETFSGGLEAWQNSLHPEDRDKTIEECQVALRGEKEWNTDFRILHPNGTLKYIKANGIVIRDSKGTPVRMLGINFDITDRKKAEEALREREEKYRNLFNNAEVGIFRTRLDGSEVLEINNRFLEIVGMTLEETLGKPSVNLWADPKEREEMEKRLIADGSVSNFEYKMLNKRQGNVKNCITSLRLYREQGILEGTILDITERKRAEEKNAKLETRLQQSQKMESIGSLAGGIAHDLNNILFPITGLSEMLLDDIPPDNPAHENIEQILKSAKRGSALVRQILAFSRQSNPQRLPIRIQPILKEVLKLARATIPMNIEITSHIKPDCGMVSADPTQVHQIAMNLITNAYHAVEGNGGMIHIALKEAEFEKDESPFHEMQSGRYACITVYDTGAGIDQTLIDKIFEPYFTTKELGKGTGLGLSVVHGIVKEHGGDIRVYSEVGKGTTFHVYLPLLEDARDSKTAAVTRKYPTGCESILLVDDEEPIVRMEQKILERLGYQVTARMSSPDALDAFRANPSKFDLVISDRGMPNMTGDQLARELISIRSEIPIILCTGFSDETDEQRAKAMGVKGFLMKPVATGDLATMVRKVLDEGQAAY